MTSSKCYTGAGSPPPAPTRSSKSTDGGRYWAQQKDQTVQKYRSRLQFNGHLVLGGWIAEAIPQVFFSQVISSRRNSHRSSTLARGIPAAAKRRAASPRKLRVLLRFPYELRLRYFRICFAVWCQRWREASSKVDPVLNNFINSVLNSPMYEWGLGLHSPFDKAWFCFQEQFK